MPQRHHVTRALLLLAASVATVACEDMASAPRLSAPKTVQRIYVEPRAGCFVLKESPTACGVTVSIVPWYEPEVGYIIFWNTDPSGPTYTGQDTVVETFSKPVTQIDMMLTGQRIYGWTPTVFTDSWGHDTTISLLIGQADTTVRLRRGISKIRYLPGPPNQYSQPYVEYSVEFAVGLVECPPTKDSVLDSTDVRQQLVSVLQQAMQNHLEITGYIYWNTTTKHYELVDEQLSPNPAQPNVPSECRSSKLASPQYSDATHIPVAGFHTHPIGPGQVFTNCPQEQPGAKAAAGPSTFDYSAVNTTKLPEYIIDPGTVYEVIPAPHWWSSQLKQTLAWQNPKGCLGWM